jgi:hypothetical protein
LKKLLLFLSALTVFATAAAAQTVENPTPQVGIADIYLAKDDGNGKAGEAATGFVTTDVPIYCVVQLDSSTSVTVKMNLVAVNVPGVKPETRVVSTSYTTKENQSRVNFTGRPAGRWVAGKYRVDVFVGNAVAVSKPFVVLSAPAAPKSSAEGFAEPRTKTARKL